MPTATKNASRPRPPKGGYVARPGSPITDAQAKVVGAELQRMRSDGVARTPKNLVSRAGRRGSSLRGLFEWDDAKAGQRHRTEWARTLINSTLIVDLVTSKPSRAFYSVVVSDGDDEDQAPREYRTRSTVLASDDALEQQSKRLYGTLLAAVEDAEGLGLGARERAWKTIIATVQSHPPAATNEAG